MKVLLDGLLHFGAPEALAAVYKDKNLRRIGAQARYRDPDAIVQPASALAKLVPEFQKISGARRLAQALTRENRSRSFAVLIGGIARLANDLDVPGGDN